MRDGQRTTTSEDRATQLLICEALSLAINGGTISTSESFAIISLQREISVTHMPKLMVQFVGRTSRVAYLQPTCSTYNTRVTSRELPVPDVSKHVRYLYFTCFHHVKYLQTTCQFSTLRVNYAPLVQVLHSTCQPCTTRAPGQDTTCHISVPSIISNHRIISNYRIISDYRIISNYRILSDKSIFTGFFYFIIDIIE